MLEMKAFVIIGINFCPQHKAAGMKIKLSKNRLLLLLLLLLTLGIKDPEGFGKNWHKKLYEWPLLRTVLTNKRIVKQNAVESLQQNRNALN